MDINGVLFEGLCYSGKSTVARVFAQRLRTRVAGLRLGHGQMSDSPLALYLQDQAFHSLSNDLPDEFPSGSYVETFNIFRSAQLLIDQGWMNGLIDSNQRSSSLFIQDRHWFSQACMNEFFTPESEHIDKEWLEKARIVFPLNVYLTCSTRSRAMRAKERDAILGSHNLSKYFVKHIDKLEVYEEFCLGKIENDSTWLIMNTDRLSVEQIVQELLRVGGFR